MPELGSKGRTHDPLYFTNASECEIRCRDAFGSVCDVNAASAWLEWHFLVDSQHETVNILAVRRRGNINKLLLVQNNMLSGLKQQTFFERVYMAGNFRFVYYRDTPAACKLRRSRYAFYNNACFFELSV